MGKIEKGILGGFSGKVGPVIGANWRGIDVMRSRPKKSSRPATEQQEIQRLKFALAIKFLSPVKMLLAKYFGQPDEDKSRENLATSYHIREAISGTFPALEINLQKVVLSKGELPGLEELEIEIQPNAVLALEWTNTFSEQSLVENTDKVLAVAYNETKSLYQYRQQVERSELNYEFALPANWSGDTVHCWIIVTSDERKLCSTSSYRGPIVLL